jgi:CBS domain-containing protein
MTLPTAEDLMTTDVLAVGADWSLDRLAEYLTEHSISGAPVVSDYGGVIGVVSITDLIRHGTDEAQPPGAPEPSEESPPAYFVGSVSMPATGAVLQVLDEADKEATVRDIMMPTTVTVEATASVQEVADRLVRGHLHRLIVVKAGTKRDVVGIITAIDVMDWVRDADFSPAM